MASVEAVETMHGLLYRRVALYLNEAGEPRAKVPSNIMLTDGEKSSLKHHKAGLASLIGEISEERISEMFSRAVRDVSSTEPARQDTCKAYLSEAQDWHESDRSYRFAEIRYWLYRAVVYADPAAKADLWWWSR